MITVYQPYKAAGSKIVYTQQLRYLTNKEDERNPKEVLMEDLNLDAEKWSRRDESIVIIGDFNKDIRNANTTEWREKLNLRDVMIHKVGSEGSPRTHQRGAIPIGTIM